MMPKLYAYKNFVTDKESFAYDDAGARVGETPNIAFAVETPEQAEFIARACNDHGDFVEATEAALPDLSAALSVAKKCFGGHETTPLIALKTRIENIVAKAKVGEK